MHGSHSLVAAPLIKPSEERGAKRSTGFLISIDRRALRVRATQRHPSTLKHLHPRSS